MTMITLVKHTDDATALSSVVYAVSVHLSQMNIYQQCAQFGTTLHICILPAVRYRPLENNYAVHLLRNHSEQSYRHRKRDLHGRLKEQPVQRSVSCFNVIIFH